MSRGELSPAIGHRLSWMSPTDTTMGVDQEPDAGNNESEQTPESSTASSHPGLLDLSTLLPAQTDLINPSFLGDVPLDFTGPFMGQDFDYTSISEGIDMDLLMPNPGDFLVGITSNGAKPPGEESHSARTRQPDPRAGSSPKRREDQGIEHGVGRDITVRVDDVNNDCAEALANFAKYPAEIVAPFRLPSKHATRRFVSAFFRHIVAHIPIVHEPTFDIATAPCKSYESMAERACEAEYLILMDLLTQHHSFLR